MKILVIGYTHSKHDKRVFRTVQAFAKSHEVVYQYLTNDEEKQYKDGNILYVPVRYGKISEKKGFREYLRECGMRMSFDKRVLDLIESTVYDICYFHHFIPTAPVSAFKKAKMHGRQVVFDIHEYHPENFMNSLKGPAKKLKELVMWRIFKKQIELSNKLIFVSEEARDHILQKTGISKLSLVIPNYSNFTIIPSVKNKEIVVVGKTVRDISKEKKILKELTEHGIRFRIIGMDSGAFRDIPHEHTNFLPYERMMEELSEASFSLISYESPGSEERNYSYSFPHKFFDSIAAGTPVIVKNTFVSMVKNVERYGVGVVIDPNDISGSVKTILDAFENYDFYRQNVEKYKELFVWDDKKEEEFLRFIFEDL